MRSKMLVLAMLAMVAGGVHAECECRCMGGQNRPICSSTTELPPLCAPTVCPLEPPSIQPLMAPQLPPLGTTNCQPRQVWNQYAQQYQWQRICQ